MEQETRFVVEIKALSRPLKVRKGSLKGVSVGRKMRKRMKQEAVDCPVLEKTVPFIECFGCQSFMRRVKGEVHCRG